ncbi:MAG: RNA polymerase sigma-70 factor [Balneolales bacterium]
MTKTNQNNTDQVRLDLIRKGDEQAFEKLFKQYYFPLTRFAWRFIESKAIAEELVQDLFTEIWENRETWDFTGELRPYLYRKIKHKCLNHFKHQKVKHKYDGQWMEQWETSFINFEDQERDQQLKLLREAINSAVDDLPSKSKMTYKLHRHDGLTYPEIAEVLNISIKTVESHMTSAMKQLRERHAHLMPFFLIALLAVASL